MPAGKLVISLLQVTSLKDTACCSDQDVYFIVHCGERSFRTENYEGTRIQCKDKFVVEIQELSQFRVEVWVDTSRKDLLLGTASVGLEQVYQDGVLKSYYPIYSDQGRYHGRVQLKTWFTPNVPSACSVLYTPPKVQIMEPHASLVPLRIMKPPAAQRPGPDSSPRKRHSAVRSLAELAARTADNAGGEPGSLLQPSATASGSPRSSSKRPAATAPASPEPSVQLTLSRSTSLSRGSFSGPLAVVSPKGMLTHDPKTGEPLSAFDAKLSEITPESEHSVRIGTGQHAGSPATTTTLHSVSSTTPLVDQQEMSDGTAGSSAVHSHHSGSGFGKAFRMCAAPETDSAPLPCLHMAGTTQQRHAENRGE